jgi:hypothetical protein
VPAGWSRQATPVCMPAPAPQAAAAAATAASLLGPPEPALPATLRRPDGGYGPQAQSQPQVPFWAPVGPRSPPGASRRLAGWLVGWAAAVAAVPRQQPSEAPAAPAGRARGLKGQTGLHALPWATLGLNTPDANASVQP